MHTGVARLVVSSSGSRISLRPEEISRALKALFLMLSHLISGWLCTTISESELLEEVIIGGVGILSAGPVK